MYWYPVSQNHKHFNYPGKKQNKKVTFKITWRTIYVIYVFSIFKGTIAALSACFYANWFSLGHWFIAFLLQSKLMGRAVVG